MAIGSFDQRYTITTNGAITFTGNTLGLSKQPTTQYAGKADSIGAMITTNNSLNVLDYPRDANAGTTLDFTKNGSYAYLSLPLGSTVLKAYLIWAGSCIVEEQNYYTSIGKQVQLSTPQTGSPFNISPDTAHSYISGSSDDDPLYYLNTQEVTSCVNLLTGGSYKITCSGVVGTTTPENSTDNACGWTLCVVYKNPTLPSRNMTVYTGNISTFVGAGQTAEATASGFETASSGVVNGRILITALEGDATREGDQVGISNKSNSFNYLYGDYNLVDNFFASQINNDYGQRDYSGSFGNQNQNPNGSNIDGGRQGWDITNVDANPAPNTNLNNSQTSTIVQFTSKGDRYWVTGAAIELDVNSPIISGEKEVDKPTVVINENLTYTITISNNGTAVANNVIVTDTLPTGLAYVSSVLPPGATISQSGQTLTISLNSSLGIKQSIQIFITAKASTIPDSGAYVNFSNIAYTYSIPGEPNNPGEAITNKVSTSIMAPLPPIVYNYTVESCRNKPVTGNITALDVDGHYPLTYSIFTPPTNGFASVDSTTGAWLYTPKVGFVGVDSFVVAVRDTEFATSYSKITINILDKPCCEVKCNQCACNEKSLT